MITLTKKYPELCNNVKNIDTKIALINGTQLAELMIDYDIGVTEITSYRLKRVDSDYFSSDYLWLLLHDIEPLCYIQYT